MEIYVVKSGDTVYSIAQSYDFDVNKIIAPLIAPIFSTPPVFFLMRLVIKNK